VLREKIDVASTLNVSKITVIPIQQMKSGKEKITHKANKTDKMLISFDVDNRIINPGTTQIYISIIGPDNATVMVPDLGSGTFKAETKERNHTPLLFLSSWKRARANTCNFNG
jgi:hypothetical protein